MLVRRNTGGYLPSIFDAFFNEASGLESSTIFTKPEFNVYENEKNFVIEAAVLEWTRKILTLN